jgi:hypothetical protein
MEVKKIERRQCEYFILEVHYAKRWPPISYAFGLFDGDELIGIITYGTPLSSTLRVGVAGHEHGLDVLELNRLCLKYNRKNEASFLIAKSLKMLPHGKIIVSYADTSQGHYGFVYQATNFIYCGLSAKRTDWKIRGKEHLHSQTISDEVRGAVSRVAALREKYGDDFYLAPRPRKHRYVYVVGSKTYKKMIIRKLKYKIEDYPKPQHPHLLTR